MSFFAKIDPNTGIVTVQGFDGDKLIDSELVLKHPFLLRVRCSLAAWRILRRQRKLAKWNKV